MRILVCGGRDFGTDLEERKFGQDYLFNQFVYIHGKHTPIVFITGMARGADQFPLRWEHYPNVTIEKYPADWDKYKKAAGPIRNQQMIDEGKPDLIIAFPGGSGTADMVRRGRKAGIEVREITYG